VPTADTPPHFDLASLSAHKMHGPPGIGALYVRRALLSSMRPLLHGGGQQNGLRSGTVPLPLAVGFGISATLCQGDAAEAEREDLRARRDRFVARLQALGWQLHINGSRAYDRHPGNANIRFEGIDGRDLLETLQPKVSASTGSACSSGPFEPSHVLLAMGMSQEAANQCVRFSLGRFTTDADVDAAIAEIGKGLDKVGNANNQTCACETSSSS
jgi:cysteine desulfurase